MHQDEYVPLNELSRLEQMNIKMDWLAKVGVNLVIEGELTPPEKTNHPLGFCPIHVNNQPILQQMSQQLYMGIAEIKLHQLWLTKQRYTII